MPLGDVAARGWPKADAGGRRGLRGEQLSMLLGNVASCGWPEVGRRRRARAARRAASMSLATWPPVVGQRTDASGGHRSRGGWL